jgi:hypothetical protein
MTFQSCGSKLFGVHFEGVGYGGKSGQVQVRGHWPEGAEHAQRDKQLHRPRRPCSRAGSMAFSLEVRQRAAVVRRVRISRRERALSRPWPSSRPDLDGHR